VRASGGSTGPESSSTMPACSDSYYRYTVHPNRYSCSKMRTHVSCQHKHVPSGSSAVSCHSQVDSQCMFVVKTTRFLYSHMFGKFTMEHTQVPANGVAANRFPAWRELPVLFGLKESHSAPTWWYFWRFDQSQARAICQKPPSLSPNSPSRRGFITNSFDMSSIPRVFYNLLAKKVHRLVFQSHIRP
jgi:hypothetical protein